MKTPHKHAEVLRAIADGNTVQFQRKGESTWVDRKNIPESIDPITNDDLP